MDKKLMIGLGLVGLGFFLWKSNQKKGVVTPILDRK